MTRSLAWLVVTGSLLVGSTLMGQASVVYPAAPVYAAASRRPPGRALPLPLQAEPEPRNYGVAGALIGGTIGLLLGIWFDIEARQLDGDQTLGQVIVAPLVIMAITVPVGALIGGAIPRPPGPGSP